MHTWLLLKLDSSWSLRISLKLPRAKVVSMPPSSHSFPSYIRMSGIPCFLSELMKLWSKLVIFLHNKTYLVSVVNLMPVCCLCWKVFEYLLTFWMKVNKYILLKGPKYFLTHTLWCIPFDEWMIIFIYVLLEAFLHHSCFIIILITWYCQKW